LSPLAPGGSACASTRAEAAGAVEILSHVPLAGAALEFAHRAVVETGIAGDAAERLAQIRVFDAAADHHQQLRLIVKCFRSKRAHDRGEMRVERGLAAHEDRGIFRLLVPAFLGVFEIIEPEANDLARARYRQRESDAAERNARGGRCTLRHVAERFEVAVVLGKPAAEVARDARIDRLQVDNAVTLDDTEPQCLVVLKPDDFQHPPNPRCIADPPRSFRL
jgi:hypothetical protein